MLNELDIALAKDKLRAQRVSPEDPNWQWHLDQELANVNPLPSEESQPEPEEEESWWFNR